MPKFLLVRSLEALVALWVITLIVFGLTHLSGNPVGALLPDDASQEQIDFLIARLGLDQPLPVQYWRFLTNALQGDFGQSMKWPGESAMQVVLTRMPATLQLGGTAMLISIVIAIPLGVVAAARRGSWVDSTAQAIALVGQSMPSFWLGIILIWVLSVWLGWFPTSGAGSLWHLVLPAVSIAWFQISALTRLTRSAMLEVMDAEYIKLARAKGVSEVKITWKHALRNAAIVPLTYFGVLAGSVLTGSVVIETVFSWPGLGWIAIEAIKARDFPVVQSVVIVFAVIFILANLLVDLLYAYVDPRIR
ncbi:ABC transporter permease [Ketogulonicigenium vulgare]|uniref:ABC-type transporter, permease component: PepT family protein n=1 Tax=Ketogulonicigenium vulgare (strain WSH-001) TaxID=759362 RepID=F9YAV1_KETVW|nr:ABC transporter permease [Ketogulonicigenium vulgare]ADO43976.1 oligopeptide ABC transporter (permease) [Ketogulonicigenium vulgare Y25]AEM42503.1 ABC-type transporter, permease component: PepT family protein [Ketogulonicigenium vulgare WSH-001]ALJ82543.1 ABC transporter permease [Ketogulonicigenium vulgare]ANW35317.1 ABC transporter permease [Ketogulonicigenium vulgare]AOZ53208.1 oligopeptide ABC transporter (permease) [Ketogulonicigenium vulgare]